LVDSILNDQRKMIACSVFCWRRIWAKWHMHCRVLLVRMEWKKLLRLS
jgi:hypothetical protein